MEFVGIDLSSLIPRKRKSVSEMSVEEYITYLDKQEHKDRLRRYKECRKLIEEIDAQGLGIRELHLLQHIIEWFDRKHWLARSQVIMLGKLSRGLEYHQILPLDSYGNEVL